MVKKIGQFRRKTRHKLSKSGKEKGKISLTKYFQKFEVGEKVVLKAEPAVQTGMYHPNYHGLQGTIKAKIGSCYEITISDRAKQKVLIVHPVHLVKV